MASKLGIAVSTVQGWKQRDAIPVSRLAQIRAAAAMASIDLAAPAPETPASFASEPKADAAKTAAAASGPPRAQPAPERRVKAPAAHRDSRGVVLAGVMVVLLAAGIGYGVWGLRPSAAPPSASPGAARDPQVARRLAALEDTAAALKSRLEAAPSLGASATELASLRTRIEALARERAAPADGAALAELTARLDHVQAQTEAATAALTALKAEIVRLDTTGPRADAAVVRALALAGAAGRLRAAVASGRSIAEELAAARQAAAGTPALLAALAPLGEGAPIADRAQLLEAFPARASAALAAVRTQAGETWTERSLARLAGVISVRRVGAEVPGEGAEARIARAEAQLKLGALALATEELARLPSPALAEFASWLAGARQRLAAEAALSALDAEAATALAAAARAAPRPQP